MRIIFLTLLSLLIAVTSCKKKGSGSLDGHLDVFDTVKPLSYFPAFPGSFWTYLQKNKGGPDLVITLNVAPEYQRFTIGGVTSYVPIYNSDQAIYGYKRTIKSSDTFLNPNFNTFLSETTGDVYTEIYPRESHYVSIYKTERMVLTKQYLNAKNTNVLVVEGRFIWKNTQGQIVSTMSDRTHKTYREYTKDIGLTFHSVVDSLNSDTISRISLYQYRIGKP